MTQPQSRDRPPGIRQIIPALYHQARSLLVICVLLSLPTCVSCSGGGEIMAPKVHEWMDKAYRWRNLFIVMIIICLFLLAVLLLMCRISRTYKLSLIATEARLQTVLLQTNDVYAPKSLMSPVNFLQSDNYLPQRRARTPSARLKRNAYSDSHIRHPSMRFNTTDDVGKNGLRRGDTSDISIGLDAIAFDEEDDEPRNSNSIWKTVGDLLIHVKKDGTVDTHSLDNKPENRRKTAKPSHITPIQKPVDPVAKSSGSSSSSQYSSEFNELASGSSMMMSSSNVLNGPQSSNSP